MTTHELKTWPEFFQEIWSGNKTFEIRKNDRNFKIGDFLLLKKWDYSTKKYTGRESLRKISYMTNFGMQEGFICMAIIWGKK